MTDRKFAQGTKISSEKSEMEIRNMLKRFGASSYVFYEDDANIGFSFEYASRRVRIVLKLPDPEAEEFTTACKGNQHGKFTTQRSARSQYSLWEKECNRRWRALVLTVKAKLISVQEEIRTFEQEFLYDLVIPNTNQTVGEWMKPQLDQVYLTGKLPPLLPGIGETGK